MTKKNLIILLLVPFVITLLGVVTINTTYNYVDPDIVAIKWDYDDVEGFKISEGSKYELKAVGVNQRNTVATKETTLIWSIKNKNLEEDLHAEIEKIKDTYYLKPLTVGEVTITCSNEKGNVTKSMTGIIYDNGAILVSTLSKTSSSNIDPVIYYGDTDLVNNEKVDAEIPLQIKVLPSELINDLQVLEISDNITYDKEKSTIKLSRDASAGPAFITFSLGDEEVASPSTFSFTIVKDGINVYSYNDLLYCTNESSEGEIVVLRKSFESLDNAYQFDDNGNIILKDGKPVLKDESTLCFGNYDVNTKDFNFKNEIYSFVTTYNKNYIEQWNKYATTTGSKTISDKVYAGLHVQKNLYGNGYSINFHNLTFPTSVVEITTIDGTVQKIPQLAAKDLYRGPLPFYALGDHNNMPLIEALGQDNTGIYLDGSNITINDLNVRNCDFGSIMETLKTVGNVVDVYGENNTIKNSRLSNGRNVLRSFSSKNLKVDNSMISYARCFLVTTGANEYVSINEEQMNSFTTSDGSDVRLTISEFLKTNGVGDKTLNDYLLANFASKDKMKMALEKLQAALNNASKIPDTYAGTMTINDTLFYNSNVACIGIETLFNGPFLYSGSPSYISDLLSQMFSGSSGYEAFYATNVSGISYPVYVEITGKTKFYNYQTIDKNPKTTDGEDISDLINENITSLAASLGEQYAVEVNIEKFFPIKNYLYNECSPNHELYWSDNKAYINVAVAFYGGGVNNSVVELNNMEKANLIGGERRIDLTDSYLDLTSGNGFVGQIKNMMLKSVTVVTGFEPFKFRCVKADEYLFGETPQVSELIENARRVK